MTYVYVKLAVIALWCGQPSWNSGVTTKGVDRCRQKVFACVQEKSTALQIESCFIGTKID